MRIYLVTLALIWMGIQFVSCIPDPLEVKDVPIPESSPVVGSQIIPDQFIVITLTQNFNALTAGPDSDFESVIDDLLLGDVEVFVEADDEMYELEELIDGVYAINDLPQSPGTRYTLQFQNPFNLDTTSAVAYSLPLVSFDRIIPKLNFTEYDTLLEVHYSFKDAPGPNWYMINVQKLDSEIELLNRPFVELLSDEEFDGTQKEDDFTVFFRDFSDEDTVLISLTNISEPYFEFLELRNNQQYLFLDGLGEPVNYPTNVNNGLGFFNVHLPDIRLFDLSEDTGD